MAVKESGWVCDTAFSAPESLRCEVMMTVSKASFAAPALLSCTGWRYLPGSSCNLRRAQALPREYLKSFPHEQLVFNLQCLQRHPVWPSLWLWLPWPLAGALAPFHLSHYSVTVEWALQSQIFISVLLHTFLLSFQPCPLLPGHTGGPCRLLQHQRLPFSESLISNLVFSSNVTSPSMALTLIANCSYFNNLKVMRPSVLHFSMRSIGNNRN